MTAPLATDPAPPASGGELPTPSPRLAMADAAPGRPSTRDGAWWPRSRSLVAELPALVTALHRRGIRVTRVAYNVGPWEVTPRKLHADGRVIRLGWFRTLDPHRVSLTGSAPSDRVELLVVPPEASDDLAERMMAHPTSPRGRPRAPTRPDATALPPVEPPNRQSGRAGGASTDPATLFSEGRWESEGGRHR